MAHDTHLRRHCAEHAHALLLRVHRSTWVRGRRHAGGGQGPVVGEAQGAASADRRAVDELGAHHARPDEDVSQMRESQTRGESFLSPVSTGVVLRILMGGFRRGRITVGYAIAAC